MVAAPSEATDNQLVEAARAGSDAAFEALFRRYGARITAYVRSIVGDHGRAEDIVQDVFMSALRSMRATDREVVFKPWVYEIAKNACIDHIRRARRTSEVSIDSDDFTPGDEGRLSAGVATTDAAYSAREDMDALRMAFNDLPDAQREILVGRELEGLSYDTISTRTGLSRSAVESMLFRARRTLKDTYDDIATGERCQRMQTVMTHLVDGQIGLRQERRLIRHLQDCVPCRREAVALGLDDLLFAAPSRTRSALSRVAAFLPLPAFLRRRWLDGAGLLGSSGSPGAVEQGTSLAAKAAIVLAAAAIAGGGAGVAEKAGVIGHGGSTPASPAGQAPARVASPSPKSPSAAGKRARTGKGRSGSRLPQASPRAGAPATGPAHGGDAGAGRAGSGNPLDGAGAAIGGAAAKGGGAAGGTVGGVVGRAGSGAGGTIDNTVKGVGGAVDNLGGAAGNATQSAGTTLDSTVKGALKTVDNTAQQLGGAVGAAAGTGTPAASAPPLHKLLP
jgi:RNA polymerase sigma factor (sigma-70 family)